MPTLRHPRPPRSGHAPLFRGDVAGDQVHAGELAFEVLDAVITLVECREQCPPPERGRRRRASDYSHFEVAHAWPGGRALPLVADGASSIRAISLRRSPREPIP